LKVIWLLGIHSSLSNNVILFHSFISDISIGASSSQLLLAGAPYYNDFSSRTLICLLCQS